MRTRRPQIGKAAGRAACQPRRPERRSRFRTRSHCGAVTLQWEQHAKPTRRARLRRDLSARATLDAEKTRRLSQDILDRRLAVHDLVRTPRQEQRHGASRRGVPCDFPWANSWSGRAMSSSSISRRTGTTLKRGAGARPSPLRDVAGLLRSFELCGPGAGAGNAFRLHRPTRPQHWISSAVSSQYRGRCNGISHEPMQPCSKIAGRIPCSAPRMRVWLRLFLNRRRRRMKSATRRRTGRPG